MISCISFSKPQYGNSTHCSFQDFGVQKKKTASNIRRLAIELDSLVATKTSASLIRRTFLGSSGFHPYKSLTSLNELWLVCLRDKEVVYVIIDTSGVLGVGKWTFSTSLNCDISKSLFEGAGDNLRPVTWHFALPVAKNEKDKNGKTMTMCGYVKKRWLPDLVVWEADKRKILRAVACN